MFINKKNDLLLHEQNKNLSCELLFRILLFPITCNFLEECGIKLFLSVYCNLEYREMVIKILLLYSNGNMLGQKFEL